MADDALKVALQHLDAALRDAAWIRSQEGWANPQRLAAMAALKGCVAFVTASTAWRQDNLVRPLTDLLSALADLEDGHTLPMLAPAPVDHRPVSRQGAAFRGYAAAIMGGLMQHGGMRKAVADQWVADRLARAGYPGVRRGTVSGWRKEALEQPAGLVGQRHTAVLKGADWTDAVARAEQLVVSLTGLLPPSGKVEKPPC